MDLFRLIRQGHPEDGDTHAEKLVLRFQCGGRLKVSFRLGQMVCVHGQTGGDHLIAGAIGGGGREFIQYLDGERKWRLLVFQPRRRQN